MKLYVILTAFLLIGRAINLSAEDKDFSNVSIMVMGGYNSNYGISKAMKGSESEFHSQVSSDYNNQVYPFGEKGTISANIGLMISSAIKNTPWSVYFAGNYYDFYLSGDYFFFLINYAWMRIYSVSAGLQYDYGTRAEIWNLFGRLGINFNRIDGDVQYLGSLTNVQPALRGGFEGEFGGRFNIPSFPVSLELSLQYFNANLIGKSYTIFSERPPQTLDKRELNDGINPGDPNDVNKSIIYITLRGGIKIWI